MHHTRRRGFILIWGWRTAVSNENLPPVRMQCPKCRGNVYFLCRVARRNFHLFYIPMGGGSPQRFLECPACHARLINNSQGGNAANIPLEQMPAQPPITTSSLAIVSLILGVLSLLCLGPLTALPGIICGILALLAISRHKDSLSGSGLAIAGLITSTVGGLVVSLVAILFIVPAVLRAREMREIPNRTADAASLRAVDTACNMYAASHSNQMPHELFDAESYMHSPAILKSKLSSVPAPASMPSSAADLNAICDWVYIGADLSKKYTGPIVLLYSKDMAPDHGRTVAFLNGNVQWVKESDLPRIFENSNRARSRAGLPPVDLDAPPPAPK